jgi:serine/threonine protein kinase
MQKSPANLGTVQGVVNGFRLKKASWVNGKPKLADIGLVTDASDTCSIVGTEGYLPPEGPGTPQADLFALGKVLYEAATGLDRRQLPLRETCANGPKPS